MVIINKALIAGSVAALLVAQTAGAFVIDSFNVLKDIEVSSIAAGVAVSQVSQGSQIVGTYRDIMVMKTSGGGASKASIYSGGDTLYFGQDVPTKGLMTLTYDGNSTAGDLSLGNTIGTLNSTYATLRVVADHGGSLLSLSMWEAGSTPILHSWTARTSVEGSYDYKFNYSDVGLASGKNIAAIQLSWSQGTAVAGTDASFQWFGEGDPDIPEPSTMILMVALVGMGGFGALRKRLTKKA